MSQSTNYIDILAKHETSLSAKAKTLFQALQDPHVNHDKAIRLIRGILYETLVDYKNQKSSQASIIILTCIQWILKDWEIVKNPSTLKLAALVKEALKRACMVECDIVHFRSLGCCVSDYISQTKHSSDQVTKWFFYGINQFCKKGLQCCCSSGKSHCPSLQSFHLELQGLGVQHRCQDGAKFCDPGGIVTAAVRHLNQGKFDRNHLLEVVGAVDVFFSDKEMWDASELCLNLAKDIIFLEGCFLLEHNTVSDIIKRILVSLQSLHVVDAMKSNHFKKNYLAIFGPFMSTMIKNCKRLNGCLGSGLDCIYLFCSAMGDKLSIEVLVRIAYFCHKVASPENVEAILDKMAILIDKNGDVFDFKQPNDENFSVKFFEAAVQISMVAVNCKNSKRFDMAVEHLLQKTLSLLLKEEHAEGARITSLLVTAGTIRIKVKRKLGQFLSAMEEAEMIIAAAPFKIVHALVSQWTKAKVFAVRDAKSNVVEELKTRTLAHNLVEKIPKRLLFEILQLELNMYQTLKAGLSDQLAVIKEILDLDIVEVEKIRPRLTSKRILLEFELGEALCGSLDFDCAYEICKLDKENWEYLIQVKMVQFLRNWNLILASSGDEFPKYVSFTQIYDIVDAWVVAAKENWPLLCVHESCKLAHDCASVIQLFGKSLLKLKLMGSLHKLLMKNGDVSEMLLRLRNSCSTLCEIASSYLTMCHVSEAEKYINLAYEAFDRYNDYRTKHGANDPELKAYKVLFFQLNCLCAAIHAKQGKDMEASKLLDLCSADDFIKMENMKCSTTAVYCSIQVLNVASNLISSSSDPHTVKLQAALKRIAALKASILPGFHSVQKFSLNFEKQSFGVGVDGISPDIQRQFEVIILFFENLFELALGYILSGDAIMAASYVKTGLIHAKYLHLKTWYLRFCLLKLKLTSYQQNEEIFQELCKDFCKLLQCDCMYESQRGGRLEDSFLRGTDDEEAEQFEVSEEDIKGEVLGSTDDDAVLIPTKPVDVGCYLSSDDNVSASPIVSKPKRNPVPLPPIFQKMNLCSCTEISRLDNVALQLSYANTFAEHCTRSNMIRDGLDVSSKASKVIMSLVDEPVVSELDEVRAKDFLGEQHVELEIVSAWLHFLRYDSQKALSCCEATSKIISSCGTITAYTLSLKSKMHFLLSRSLDQQRKLRCHPAIESDCLNALIDGLAKTFISEPTQDVHTPVSRRLQRKGTRLKTSTAEAKVKVSTTKGKSTRTRKGKATDEFKIFTDESENKKTLPVPELSDDRSPSQNARNVYDFESSDEGKKTPGKVLLKDSQNIMLARKAAGKRHRKKYGMVYTSDAKERVRARHTKSKSRVKTNAPELKEETPVSKVEDSSCSITEQILHLKQALHAACQSQDFLMTKYAAQSLSHCYYDRFNQTGTEDDLTQSSVFHLFSVGVCTRATMQAYTKTMANVDCTEKSCGDACRSESGIKSFVEQQKILHKVLELGGKYVKEGTDLLPESWTVCVISTSLIGDSSAILITRLRHGEETLHVEVYGDALRQAITTFEDLMERNAAALSSRDQSYWWTQRRNLNAELKDLVESFSQSGLGEYVGVIQGKLMDGETSMKMKQCASKLCGEFQLPERNFPLIEVLLNSWHSLSVEQKLRGVLDLCKLDKASEETILVAKELENLSRTLNLQNEDRGHVILILDKDIQLLPWENAPQLQNFSVTRVPSFDLLKVQLGLLQSAERNIAKEGVNFEDVSYILNPSGDLKKSEERFQSWFQSVKSWKGIVSRAPMQNEWIASITDFDLFIYCGHGSGQKYVSCNDFRNIRTRAAALLMGCGSAKLDQEGVFEPAGITVHYLMTGSPCVLGCLWKVTDKDTDIYLCKLIQHWADGKKRPISLCAKEAQRYMKMPYINGSACVIYGLPIHCQVTVANFLQTLPKI